MIRYIAVASVLTAILATPLFADGPYLANGIKIGEVDQTSAIIWVRTTKDKQADPSVLDAAPGMEGDVSVIVGEPFEPFTVYSGVKTNAAQDFTGQFHITDLRPGAYYDVTVRTHPVGGTTISNTAEGSFRTAPAVDQEAPVDFAVVTCQSLRSNDCGDFGHSPYKLIPKLDPDFFVHTGDVVYYDKEPFSTNAKEARQKWNCMYGFFHNRDFHKGVASYFMKDDHDCVKNDCWAEQSYHDLTWDEGLAIFREQVPMGEKTYRTVRWGRDVQIWMTENRDFRSPNTMRDGPEKTILGAEQKQWLEETMKASDATFKFLIMPGPLVGPDKRGKKDNHSNAVFQHEGDWLRELVASRKNTFVINGDRHWQYHSVHPELGINEFGCGPINDLHGYGGNPGNVPEYHKYFHPGGGWLSVSVERKEGKPTATFRHYAAGPEIEDLIIRNEVTFEAE